ncbi:MAG: penicillin acylase family protein [Candidatus Lernaella stagnicola]|nr:penicillin acylase family protein [Candidatus Lernaella stagnicola]
MKRIAIALSFLLVFTLSFAACGPVSRYLGYRMSPDTVDDLDTAVVPVAGLPDSVTVYLDEYAIPHISATDEYSLYYALGYMQGRDRRFQLEMFKMVAAGRLRELIGDNDDTGVMTRLEVFSRVIGLYQDAEEFVAELPPKDRRIMQAFADGINQATANEPQPMEFRILDYEPEQWTTLDCGLVMAMVRFGLCKNWELELGRMEMLLYQLQTGGSIERTLDIWPPRYRMGPFLVGEPLDQDPFADIPPVAPELADYLQTFAEEHPLSLPAPEVPSAETSFWTPLASRWSASNNWAVDGEWTGTGKSALASDPHMPHLLPPMGYLFHAECRGCEDGDFNVIGGSFVGLPAIAFGTNGKVAWGATSNWADVSDLYVEKTVAGHADQYLHEGKAYRFEERDEVFKIHKKRRGYDTETMRVRSTRHGVVINDFMDRLPEDFPILSLRREKKWGQPISALRQVYLADDVEEARQAMYGFSAMIGHWALADADGAIGYVGTARVPRRKAHLGTIPAPGWLEKYEWGEIITPDKLPQATSPSTHWIGTANNQVVDPAATDYPLALEGDVPQRSGRIRQVLGTGNDGRPVVEQMRSLHLDNVDLGWLTVRELYTKALTSLRRDADPLVAEATQALLSWDGRNEPTDVAPGLFQALNAQILKVTLADETNPAALDFQLHFFNAEPMAFSIFANADNPAWDDRSTPETETAMEVIAAAFRTTVEAMRAEYGRDLQTWQWSRVAPFVLEHPFGGSSKAIGKHVNRGPIPTAGSGNTLFKHQFMRAGMTKFPVKYGPVLRVNIDLADLSASTMSLPGGQSGRPTSSHYDDLLPFFLEGTGVPMTMDFKSVRESAASRIVFESAE